MSVAVSNEPAPRILGTVIPPGTAAFAPLDGKEICTPGTWLSTRVT